MTAVRARHELLPQLRIALATRLLEIDERENAPLPPRCADTDAEEMLRKLMVRYRPGIARRDIPAEKIPDLLLAAESVASHAGWDDLRFIDALNSIYEAWQNDFQNDARPAFLAIYRRALQTMMSS